VNQDSSGQDQLLYVALPVAMLGIMLGMLYTFVPPVRWFLFVVYAVSKLFSAILALDFTAAGDMVDAIRALQHTPPSKVGFDGFSIINRYGAAPWREGLAVTLILMGCYFALVRWAQKRVTSVTEEEVVETFRNKTLEEVVREWELPEEVLQIQDPEKLAEIFYEARQQKNIPPSIIGRKMRDRKLRDAIIYFNRILRDGTAMKQITDPDEVKRLYLEEVKKMQEFTESKKR